MTFPGASVERGGKLGVSTGPDARTVELSGTAVLVALVLLFVGMTVNAAGLTNGDVQPFEPAIHPVELLWVPLGLVLTVRTRHVSPWSAHRWAVVLSCAALVTLVALAHPGWSSLAQLVRLSSLVLAARLTAVSATSATWRRALTMAIVGLGATQLAIGVAQVTSGGPLGLHTLGELRDAVVDGDVVRAAGTLPHAYVLAWLAVTLAASALLLAARWGEGRGALGGYSVCLAVVSLTAGRTAILAGVLVVLSVVVVPRLDRRWLWVGVGVLALAFGALVNAGSWGARVDQASAARDLDALSVDRLTLMEDAAGLMADEPITGVGLGAYSDSLERLRPDALQRVVHNVPLLAGAEGGVVVFLLVCLGLVGLNIASVVDRTFAPVFAAFAPFALFDNVSWTRSQGTFAAGLLLGLALAEVSAHADRQRPVTHPAEEVR